MAEYDELSIAIETDGSQAIKTLEEISDKIGSIGKALDNLSKPRKLANMAQNLKNVFSIFSDMGSMAKGATREMEKQFDTAEQAIEAKIEEMSQRISKSFKLGTDNAVYDELKSNVRKAFDSIASVDRGDNKTFDGVYAALNSVADTVAQYSHKISIADTDTKEFYDTLKNNKFIVPEEMFKKYKDEFASIDPFIRSKITTVERYNKAYQKAIERGAEPPKKPKDLTKFFTDVSIAIENGGRDLEGEFGQVARIIAQGAQNLTNAADGKGIEQVAGITEPLERAITQVKVFSDIIQEIRKTPFNNESLTDLVYEISGFSEEIKKAYRTFPEGAYSADEAVKVLEKDAQQSFLSIIDNLAKISQAFNDLNENCTNATSALSDFVGVAKSVPGNLGKIIREVGKANSAVANLGKSNKSGTIDNLKNDISGLATSTSNMTVNFQRIGEAYSNAFILIGEAYDGCKNKINEFEVAVRNSAVRVQQFFQFMNNTFGGNSKLLTDGKDRPIDVDYRFVNNTSQEQQKQVITEEQLAKKTQEVQAAMKQVFDIAQSVGNALGKTLSMVTRFSSAIINSVLPIKALKAGFNNLQKSSQKMAMSVIRIYRMLRLMVLRSILRAMISGVNDGFKNLIQYSDEFNAKISLLWNDLRQLGNSIAAMVEPIVNAFAPAIDFLIQKLISFINVLNQVFSALTGNNTWTRAKKLTDDYRKSLDKSNKSQSKTLQGFDELNNITTSDSGGASAKDMFEDVPIADKWKKFADDLKNMWKDGNFYKLGKQFGDWLANFLADIPWDEIRKNANKLGRSLATLINGIMDGVAEDGRKLSTLIGYTIAQALNTAFEFVNGFVNNLNWTRLGQFIGELFNGLLEGIDWVLIADTAHKGVRGIVDAINAFVDAFNWDNISTTIANAFNVITDAIWTFFHNVDWKKIFGNLGKQLAETIRKIDWKQAGKAFGSVVSAIIDAIVSFIKELSFKDVVNALSDFFKGVAEELGTSKMTAIALLIGGYFVSSLANAFASVWIPILANALAEFIAKSLLTGALQGTVTSALSSVAATISTAFSTFLGPALAVVISGAMGYAFGNLAGQVFTDDDELYKNFKFADFFDTLLANTKKSSGILDFFTNLKQNFDDVCNAWELMKNDFENNAFIATLTTSIQVLMDSLNYLINPLALVKDGVDVISTAVDTAGTKIGEFLLNQPKFVEFANGIIASGNNILTSFTTICDKIKEKLSGIAEKLGKVGDAISDIKNGKGIAFSGGSSIRGFASGGFPTSGQLFLARESGAELIGSMGSKTTVANNNQIVDGIASGVANANTQQNAIFNQMVSLLGVIADKDLTIGDDDVYNSFQRGSRRYAKRYGV